MCDEWMPPLTLPMSADVFRRLPRHPAYRYEYADGAARLTPRPRHYHATLDLRRYLASAPAGDAEVRHAEDRDFDKLTGLFAAAFGNTQPFAGLTDDENHRAAKATLAKARDGGDGPWMRGASFVAEERGEPCGAIVVTLLPGGDPRDADSYYWPTPVPDVLWDSCPGQPHVTWLFVNPVGQRRGIATGLLTASARSLVDMGHTELWSTFMCGNEASLRWHWRRGFELVG